MDVMGKNAMICTLPFVKTLLDTRGAHEKIAIDTMLEEPGGRKREKKKMPLKTAKALTVLQEGQKSEHHHQRISLF